MCFGCLEGARWEYSEVAGASNRRSALLVDQRDDLRSSDDQSVVEGCPAEGLRAANLWTSSVLGQIDRHDQRYRRSGRSGVSRSKDVLGRVLRVFSCRHVC